MTVEIQPTFDASAQWDAVKALLTTTAGDDVYDYGEVPGADGNQGKLPTAFVVFSMARRYVPASGGRTSVTGWRISCRFVGTTVPNARLVGTWITAALNEATVTVGGATSTPITHESTTAVAKDEDRFSGVSTWTYAITL